MNFLLFLTHSESFLEFNTNILETNLINIFILIGLLFYGYKTSFRSSLEIRQKQIIEIIENSQRDVLNAYNFSKLAEKNFSESLFWLQSCKNLYQKEKIEIVNLKYNLIKNRFLESFLLTENLITNLEQKSFINLQRYIVLIIVSKILRKFFFLSEQEQYKLIEVTLAKLGNFVKK